MTHSETLWSPGTRPDEQMLAYTVADDREVDARLLRWDVIGSLGHVEALARGGIISNRERNAMRRALLAALRAADTGELRIEAVHEDGHTAVELWLTRHFGDVGERLHAGRSRNDQVVTDLRLYLKDEVLRLHAGMLGLAGALLDFATTHRRTLWPGFTHQRIAMPSSAGQWAAGYAEGLLDAASAIVGFWPRLDRSPLGSGAGYGVPLPLHREAAATALGFGGVDQVVTTVQNGRGRLEAAVLGWCAEAAHECSRLSADVILYSAAEFGWLVLPVEFTTGSSIMPQKRNPDVFELTRARAAALEGDLVTVLLLRGKLSSGYHRDFQLLKAPLMRGVDRTREMLGMMAAVVPHLGVDAERGLKAITGDALATDEVMRRVMDGLPFRRAYREVAAAIKSGEAMPPVTAATIIRARMSTGAMGNLPVAALRAQARKELGWNRRVRQHFERAMGRLVRGGSR